ncbi:MAG: acetyl-coenzyme A synthetase N-terminal domain-containing protein, partial [Acidobacteriota bacterium]
MSEPKAAASDFLLLSEPGATATAFFVFFASFCIIRGHKFFMHDVNLLEDQPIAWTPTPDVIERSQLTKFMRQVDVSTWEELYQYSINDVEKFTEEVIKFLDIKFDPPYEKLLDTSDGIEFPKWFA